MVININVKKKSCQLTEGSTLRCPVRNVKEARYVLLVKQQELPSYKDY